MMASSKSQRVVFFVLMALTLGGAILLILTSLQKHMVYFYAPQDITDDIKRTPNLIRVGGLVVTGSYKGHAQTMRPCHDFIITDYKKNVSIHYEGLVPDLFREGQGVIAQGCFDGKGVFQAQQLLAKHDETYMPPELAKKMDVIHEKEGT